MRISRLTAVFFVLAAAGATYAYADGGGKGFSGTGVAITSRDGRLMYVTQTRPKRGVTIVRIMRGGRTTRSISLRGGYGVPMVAADRSTEGLSHDGRTLVLEAETPGRFAVLDAQTLAVREIVRLPVQFTYDALSPRGKTLYLIQHVYARNSNANRYYVRAYDLVRHRLLKKIVFDRRENWGLMSGSPVTRATSASGKWVYTLYSRPGGSPFVHALDAVNRRAVCVDLPWRGSQTQVFRMKLKLNGTNLVINADWATRHVAVIDTKTFRVTS
ncbi:MAG: hypothetical protein H0W87_01015 [Actinobacteria bacterium]|nr:hypothetical protein [Actinomycetota bacterium]